MPPLVSNNNADSRVFIGFPYSEPYRSRYGMLAASTARESGWEPVMPLDAQPGGLLVDRIAAMINGADRALYEVGTENGNVSFEIGISAALRQPTALLSDRDPASLAGFLRSPWLFPYVDDEAFLGALKSFLTLETPEPLIRQPGTIGVPSLVRVVGTGTRARAIEETLSTSGHTVAPTPPGAIRSLEDALQLAESCGVLIGVRPDVEAWEGNEAVALLATLGAAFGSRRDVIVAAGLDQTVPSDCEKLVVRGSDDSELAASVLARIVQSPPLPPGGTTRPRVEAALQRPLRTPVADELRSHGRALLSAEPGYGKTTLLRQVADDLSYPTAWVTIETNWSVSDFIERIVTAVGRHVPSYGWEAWAAVQRAQQATEQAGDRASSPSAPNPAQLADLLSQHDAATLGEPVLLVLDDVHKATEAGAEFLARLARAARPWLLMALAGRGAPAEILSSSRAGHFPSWGAEELRFSREETHAYLRQTIAGLDDERADRLYERSQGWQAALSVMRAWLAMNPDASIETLSEMTGGNRHQIYRVFATDYFTQLPEHIQHDLLICSLPFNLDADVARHLFGQDGGIRLRALVDGPYFLAEDEAGTFRLHSLFGEFLNQRWIDERGRDSLQAAQSELARWYLTNRDMASAYQAACEAEDWDLALTAIGPIAKMLVNQGEAEFLKQLLAPIPVEWIRQNWRVREAWVRALVYTGAPDAIAEARSLASSDAPTAVDHAVARLVLVQLQNDLGQISDQALAGACDEIAAQIGSADRKLSLSARLLSLDARTTRSADREQWPLLLAEARQIIEAAEAADAPAAAASACATAGDLANRILQDELSSELVKLRMRESLGKRVSLPTRVARATQFVARSREILDLFQKAFRLAENAENPIVLARVQITYASYLTFDGGLAGLRTGEMDSSTRQFLEKAIRFAVGAAATYSSLGIPRDVVVALNVAAQAASILGDRDRLDEFTREASRIATEFDYPALAAAATRIRAEPSIAERRRAAQDYPPFNRQSPEHLQESIETLISASDINTAEAERVRPLLRKELISLTALDSWREDVCQYLQLLRDLAGPKIGPFPVSQNWNVTCRMRGLSSVSHHDQVDVLFREFTEDICSKCDFRSPGVASNDEGESLEEIYAPMFERLSAEGERPAQGAS